MSLVEDKVVEQSVAVRKTGVLQETVETISKIGGGAILLFYVVGLLIRNIHLAQFGIFHINFLQIDYVLVGTLWAFLVLSTYCVFQLIVSTGKRIKASLSEATFGKGLGALFDGLPRYLGHCLALFFTLFFIPTALLRLSGNTYNFASWTSFWILLNLSLSVLCMSAFVEDIEDIRKNVSRPPSSPFSGESPVHNLPGRLLFLITLIISYALYTFPNLSPAFGGGKNQKVELVIKSDKVATLTSLGFDPQPESQRIGPVELVFEGSEFLIVLPQQNDRVPTNTKAIRIGKEMIDAMFYINEKPIN